MNWDGFPVSPVVVAIYVIGMTNHLYAVRDRGAIEVTQAISFLRRVATKKKTLWTGSMSDSRRIVWWSIHSEQENWHGYQVYYPTKQHFYIEKRETMYFRSINIWHWKCDRSSICCARQRRHRGHTSHQFPQAGSDKKTQEINVWKQVF